MEYDYIKETVLNVLIVNGLVEKNESLTLSFNKNILITDTKAFLIIDLLNPVNNNQMKDFQATFIKILKTKKINGYIIYLKDKGELLIYHFDLNSEIT